MCEDIEFGYRVTSGEYTLRYLPNVQSLHNEESSNTIEYGQKFKKQGYTANGH